MATLLLHCLFHLHNLSQLFVQLKNQVTLVVESADGLRLQPFLSGLLVLVGQLPLLQFLALFWFLKDRRFFLATCQTDGTARILPNAYAAA